MTMLPVCSTISNSYYSNSQVYLYGVRGGFTRHSSFTFKCISNPFNNPNPVFRKFANQFLIQELPRPNPPTSPFIINSLKPADIYSEYLSKTNQQKGDADVFAGINESLSALVCNTDTAITNTLNTITSSAQLVSNTLNETIDAYVNKFNQSVTSTLSGFSNNSKGVSSKAGVIAVDVLRQVIVTTEDFLKQGATFVVYGYESFKDILPSEVQNVLNSSQETVFYVLNPVGTTFQKLYIVFETSLGIDPNDPIVPFLLLIGTSTTLWVSYWILTYAGYAGDLSPNSTFQLLNNGKERVALIDVRPEDIRERDGIPDLRRTARFRYATVTFPEVDANVKKLLKTGKEFDDALLAAVIRSLKVVQKGSKVIVMDADGTRSKGIARSLRKIGIKRPYLVQGGFRSWVQEGLRVKEPKRETTFTILNEEAEAILEDITPQQVIGYGVGFLAAAYALLEWETTLQLVAFFGIGQTIYQRVATYENSKDFNKDVRQLLVPVKLGGQAISWAAGKLETNRNGLPTSPSSVNVQNRVLQAAAKHESQPSDSEETPTSSVNQNPDLSEA